MKKTIAGKEFEKVADNYNFNISKRHNILIVPTSDGWEAREQRVPSSGNYMDGTKEIKIVNRYEADTLEEAVKGLMKIMEGSSKYQDQINHLRTHYKRIPLDLKLEEYEEFKAKVENEGSSPVTVIKRLIRDYLSEQ